MAGSADYARKLQNLDKNTNLPGFTRKVSQNLGIGAQTRNIADLEQKALATQKLLKGLPTDVSNLARAAGGPVTSSVTNRITSERQAPIASQLDDFANMITSARTGLADKNSQLDRILGLRKAKYDTQRDTLKTLLGMATNREENAKNRQQQGYGNEALAALIAEIKAQGQAERDKINGNNDFGIGRGGLDFANSSAKTLNNIARNFKIGKPTSINSIGLKSGGLNFKT